MNLPGHPWCSTLRTCKCSITIIRIHSNNRFNGWLSHFWSGNPRPFSFDWGRTWYSTPDSQPWVFVIAEISWIMSSESLSSWWTSFYSFIFSLIFRTKSWICPCPSFLRLSFWSMPSFSPCTRFYLPFSLTIVMNCSSLRPETYIWTSSWQIIENLTWVLLFYCIY